MLQPHQLTYENEGCLSLCSTKHTQSFYSWQIDGSEFFQLESGNHFIDTSQNLLMEYIKFMSFIAIFTILLLTRTKLCALSLFYSLLL